MLCDGAELLIDAPMAQRGKRIMQAMSACAPAGSAVTQAYTGRHKLLMMYGAGTPSRQSAMKAHRKRGGRVVLWDLGYWGRDECMRLSIDGMHPTAEQLAVSESCRFNPGFTLREDASPAGPILIIGLGDKSAQMLGLPFMSWERATLERLRNQFPGRSFAWRPKGRKQTPLGNVPLRHGMPIEQAMRGCSLVVCLHSNVAIDACVAGIPVMCEGGAAHALYSGNPNPSRHERAQFLARLSWWNYEPSEAPKAWAFIQKVISET